MRPIRIERLQLAFKLKSKVLKTFAVPLHGIFMIAFLLLVVGQAQGAVQVCEAVFQISPEPVVSIETQTARTTAYPQLRRADFLQAKTVHGTDAKFEYSDHLFEYRYSEVRGEVTSSTRDFITFGSSGMWSGYFEFLTDAFATRQTGLTELHGNYAGKGPERSSHVTEYKTEDQVKAYRTTHFSYAVSSMVGQLIGRIQLMSAKLVGETVNIEDHFPPARAFIRSDGELPFEAGRLFIPKPEAVSDPVAKHLLADAWIRKDLYRRLWLDVARSFLKESQDAKAVYVLAFQISAKGITKFEQDFAPFKIRNKKNFAASDQPAEWIVKFSRDDVRALHEYLVTLGLKEQLEALLKSAKNERAEIEFPTEPSDFAILDRWGLFAARKEFLLRKWREKWDPNSELGPSLPENMQQEITIRNMRGYSTEPGIVRISQPQAVALLEKMNRTLSTPVHDDHSRP